MKPLRSKDLWIDPLKGSYTGGMNTGFPAAIYGYLITTEPKGRRKARLVGLMFHKHAEGTWGTKSYRSGCWEYQVCVEKKTLKAKTFNDAKTKLIRRIVRIDRERVRNGHRSQTS